MKNIELRDKLTSPEQALQLYDSGIRGKHYFWIKTTRELIKEDPHSLDNYSLRGGHIYGITMCEGDIILPLYDLYELHHIVGNPEKEKKNMINYLVEKLG